MKGLGLLAIVLLVIGLVVLGPLLTIWALNTLFHTGIAFTFWNWVAMFILNGAAAGLGRIRYSKKSG